MEISRTATSSQPADAILSHGKVIDSQFQIIENYISKGERARVKILARNLSEKPINEIDVYAGQREAPALKTLFYGGYDKDHLNSRFYSNASQEAPYSITTMVDRDGDYYSGQIEITKSGFLDIDIGKEDIQMNLYADREKTELVATKVLTPTPVHPSQGNHPLV